MATVVKKAPKKKAAPVKAETARRVARKAEAPVKVARKAPVSRKKAVQVAPPVVQPGDLIVLRSQHGEQSFTSNELATAQKMANEYAERGLRCSLLLYTYRPDASQKCGVQLLESKRPHRQLPARKTETDEVQSEVA